MLWVCKRALGDDCNLGHVVSLIGDAPASVHAPYFLAYNLAAPFPHT